jgi:hypothetical protein
MDGNRELGAGLLLPHGDAFSPHVLLTHADQIAAPLPGVECERKRKSGLRTNRMRGLEGGDLVFGPAVIAFAVVAAIGLDAQRRIAGDHADVDGVVEQYAQRFQQIVRRFWRVRLGADDAADVGALQVFERPMTVLCAEALEHVPAHSALLGFRLPQKEVLTALADAGYEPIFTGTGLQVCTKTYSMGLVNNFELALPPDQKLVVDDRAISASELRDRTEKSDEEVLATKKYLGLLK